MKHIKLLFSISFLLVFGSKIHSQVIKENAKFLIHSLHPNSYGMHGFFSIEQVFYDTIDDIYYCGSYPIIVKEKKIYFIDRNDTFIYFDYSLEAGDTFYFNGENIYPKVKVRPIIIDSVKSIKLDDGKYYKHWFMNIGRNIVWLEGLGEKQVGWSRYDLASIYGPPSVVSICANDTLIYWPSGFNKYNTHPIYPTCNYDSLKILNSVNKVSNFGIKIFPNPAQDYIEVSSTQNIQNADIKIYDVLGKEIWNKTNQNFPLNIDTKDFISGIYFIKISNEKGQTQTLKFMKM